MNLLRAKLRKPPKDKKLPWRLPIRSFEDSHFIIYSRREMLSAKIDLEPYGLEKLLSFLKGNVNKNYRLPFEMLYGVLKSKKRGYRKKPSENFLRTPLTNVQISQGARIKDY
jgi:hypothetical protein